MFIFNTSLVAEDDVVEDGLGDAHEVEDLGVEVGALGGQGGARRDVLHGAVERFPGDRRHLPEVIAQPLFT